MILVTGGTGLVGSHLLYALTKQGHKLRAICRKESTFDAVKKVFGYHPDGLSLYDNIEWIEANILDIPRLNDAFKDILIVYHCAAYISFDPKKSILLRKTNITGTANIVNLAISNGVKKLCYVSSVATLGRANNKGLIDEESPWNPEDDNSEYSIAKYGAEMEVWRGSQEGLTTLIVNPGVILGEGHWDSASGSLIKMSYKGVPFITKGSMGVVDVKDVIDAMLALMSHNIENQRFILVGHNCRYSQFFGQLSLAFNKTPPKRFISQFWLSALSKVDGISCFLFGTKRRLPPAMVKSMYKSDHYDSGLLRDTIQYDFRPLDVTIKRVSNLYTNDCL